MLTLGVDAHKRVHEAVALDDAGREVGRRRVPNSAAGWGDLLAWAAGLGAPRRWGDRGRLGLRPRAGPAPGRRRRDGLRGEPPLDGGGAQERPAPGQERRPGRPGGGPPGAR